MRKQPQDLKNKKASGQGSSFLSHFKPRTIQTSANTPYLVLPKIPSYLQSTQSCGMQNVDRLQNYITNLLSQEHSQIQVAKRQKQLKELMDKRKENFARQEQVYKKKRQKSSLNLLQQKLKELNGQLEVEEKKLEIEHSLQQKMMEKYTQVYDNMRYRLHYNDKRDVIAQTDDIQISTAEQGVSESPKKKESRFPPGVLLRKFRVVGYAVYFALAFPRYVKVFRQLRRKHFVNNIVTKNGLAVLTSNYYSLLQSFKLSDFYRQKERNIRRSKQQEDLTLDFQQKDKVGQTKKINVRLSSVFELTLFLLTKIKQQLQNGTLNPLIQILSFYLLDRCFPSDKTFLIDQLYRLRVNRSTLELMLNQKQEKQFLLNFIISKSTCFMFMIADRKESKVFGRRVSKQNRQNYSRQLNKALLLGGLFLFKKCNEMHSDKQYDDSLKRKGNFQKLGKQVQFLVMKEFQINQDLQILKVSSTSTISNYDKKGNKLNHMGIKYNNMQMGENIVNKLIVNSQSQLQISSMLTDITNLVHKKCLQFKKHHFKETLNNTLDHKYYLTKQIKLVQFPPPRSKQQSSSIQSCFQMITQARKMVKPQGGIKKDSSSSTISSNLSYLNKTKIKQQLKSIQSSKSQISSQNQKNSQTSIVKPIPQGLHGQPIQPELTSNKSSNSNHSIMNHSVLPKNSNTRNLLRSKLSRGLNRDSIKQLKNNHKYKKSEQKKSIEDEDEDEDEESSN